MIFDEEIKKTAESILSCRESDDLCFALLSDSHLSEQGDDTCANIKAVDELVGFDFAVHLGNIINGDNPKKISEHVLKREIEKYRGALKNGKLFCSQGDSDGWRDERFTGQLATGIITDEMWYSATGYADSFDGVKRDGKKPYYYVDVPDKNVRLIILCSYYCQLDERAELFEKNLMIDVAQQAWLKEKALAGCEDKHIIVFSHRIPKSRFETGSDPYAFEGRHTEPVCSIFQAAQLGGASLVCRIGGGYGFDSEFCHEGQNIAVIGSQIAREYAPAKCSVRYSGKRKIGSVGQDLWDAAVLKTKERKLLLFRFGCGEDRVIGY